MAEVADDAPMDLQAVKLFASYMSPGLREPGARPKPSPRAARPARAGPLAAAGLTRRSCRAALEQLAALMEDSAASGNPTLQLIAGYVYSYEQEYEKALRAIHNGYTLEQSAAPPPLPSPRL